jgi:hypothetical protein
MILIGNTDAINLATANNYYWLWIVGGCLLIGAIIIILKKNFFNTGK